ncbi:HPP family protein [Xanthobacter sp. TB0136]|uniref:HPP family protein n=1 Tax=Xanthobacter sp. TB0136 TaxID=3459177 RepID=UPI0040391937
MSFLTRLRLFRPTLAGATLRNQSLACLGACIGIVLSAAVGGLSALDPLHLMWIVPPMGASAVLLFVVPASPMAQPWPTIGGNVISAMIGVAFAHHMPLSALSAGLAVTCAIGAMSLLRCLHPPGGAAALVGLFAGASSSYVFPLVPVGLNAVVLVACAWLFHRLCGQNYPNRPVAAPATGIDRDRPWTFSRKDMAAALEEVGEAFDIDADDLTGLLRRVEQKALARSYNQLICADLMTHGVFSVRASDPPETARTLLVDKDVRRLPVLDDEGRIIGAIGLRELVRAATRVEELMSPASIALPDDPAFDLLDRYASRRVHTVFIVDSERRPTGVVTEADWLAILTRGLS